MAQADSRAMSHLHEVQLHTGLWGQNPQHPQSPLGASEPHAWQLAIGWMGNTMQHSPSSTARCQVTNPHLCPSAFNSTFVPTTICCPSYPDRHISMAHGGWITGSRQWFFLLEKLRGKESCQAEVLHLLVLSFQCHPALPCRHCSTGCKVTAGCSTSCSWMEKLCLLPLPISTGHPKLCPHPNTADLISENSNPTSSQIPNSKTQ